MMNDAESGDYWRKKSMQAEQRVREMESELEKTKLVSESRLRDWDAAMKRAEAAEDLMRDHDSWPRSKEFRAARERMAELEAALAESQKQAAAMREALNRMRTPESEYVEYSYGHQNLAIERNEIIDAALATADEI